MTDWKRAADLFESVASFRHSEVCRGNFAACLDEACLDARDFIAALRSGGPVVAVPGAAAALKDAAHYRHEDMCQGKFADCDIPRCVAARDMVAKLRVAEAAPPPTSPVTRALEAIVEASALGQADLPDALLVAAQNALGDAGDDECGFCAGDAHGECARDGRNGGSGKKPGAEKECRCLVCWPTTSSPLPVGPPRWTGTPMTTHAACLPGEGCRVEPGMRFEAAKDFLATMFASGRPIGTDDVATAVRTADALITALAITAS